MSDFPIRWTCQACGAGHDALLPDSVEDVSTFRLGCPGCGEASLLGQAVTAVLPDVSPDRGPARPANKRSS